MQSLQVLPEHRDKKLDMLQAGSTRSLLPPSTRNVIQLCFVCVENFMEKHLNSHVGFFIKHQVYAF